MDKRIRMTIIPYNGLADAGPFSLIQDIWTDLFIVRLSCRYRVCSTSPVSGAQNSVQVVAQSWTVIY